MDHLAKNKFIAASVARRQIELRTPATLAGVLFFLDRGRGRGLGREQAQAGEFFRAQAQAGEFFRAQAQARAQARV